MTAQIIDGKALAEELREGFKARVEALAARGQRPGLVVILVGEDAASQVYVRNKVNACQAIGMHSEKITYDAAVDPEIVLKRIAELNADPNIHGILVQLPLPRHFNEEAILEAIAVAKDVRRLPRRERRGAGPGQSALHPVHAVWRDEDVREGQCRPGRQGSRRHRPLQHRRQADGAVADQCRRHRHRLQLEDEATSQFHTARADILVAAVGKPHFVTADMVKPGAVVIDVGINRLPDGKLCGDVDFAGCLDVAGQITPVPGGVGPMTITMLLANTIEAAERKAGL